MATTRSSKLMKRLASIIPEEEIDARIAEIDAQMTELGRERNALDMAKRTLLLAQSTLDGGDADAGSAKAKVGIAKNAEVGTALNGSNGKPTIRHALRAVFRESPTGVMSIDQVMDALAAKGWTPDGNDPRKLVGAGISGMVHRSGELEPTDQRATYRVVRLQGNDPLTLDGVNGS